MKFNPQVLTLCMVLALSACGGSDGGSDDDALDDNPVGQDDGSNDDGSNDYGSGDGSNDDGGDDGQQSTEAPLLLTGVLIDAGPVSGVRYETPSQAGITNTEGEFIYQQEEQVEFLIGSVVLGSVPSDSFVTTAEVVGANSIEDDAAINLSRLLQTLDADGNSENGIQVPEGASEAIEDFSLTIDFNQTPEAFAEDTSVVTLIQNAGQDTAVTELIEEQVAEDAYTDAQTDPDLRYGVWTIAPEDIGLTELPTVLVLTANGEFYFFENDHPLVDPALTPGDVDFGKFGFEYGQFTVTDNTATMTVLFDSNLDTGLFDSTDGEMEISLDLTINGPNDLTVADNSDDPFSFNATRLPRGSNNPRGGWYVPRAAGVDGLASVNLSFPNNTFWAVNIPYTADAILSDNVGFFMGDVVIGETGSASSIFYNSFVEISPQELAYKFPAAIAFNQEDGHLGINDAVFIHPSLSEASITPELPENIITNEQAYGAWKVSVDPENPDEIASYLVLTEDGEFFYFNHTSENQAEGTLASEYGVFFINGDALVLSGQYEGEGEQGLINFANLELGISGIMSFDGPDEFTFTSPKSTAPEGIITLERVPLVDGNIVGAWHEPLYIDPDGSPEGNDLSFILLFLEDGSYYLMDVDPFGNNSGTPSDVFEFGQYTYDGTTLEVTMQYSTDQPLEVFTVDVSLSGSELLIDGDLVPLRGVGRQ